MQGDAHAGKCDYCWIWLLWYRVYNSWCYHASSWGVPRHTTKVAYHGHHEGLSTKYDKQYDHTVNPIVNVIIWKFIFRCYHIDTKSSNVKSGIQSHKQNVPRQHQNRAPFSLTIGDLLFLDHHWRRGGYVPVCLHSLIQLMIAVTDLLCPKLL